MLQHPGHAIKLFSKSLQKYILYECGACMSVYVKSTVSSQKNTGNFCPVDKTSLFLFWVDQIAMESHRIVSSSKSHNWIGQMKAAKSHSKSE